MIKFDLPSTPLTYAAKPDVALRSLGRVLILVPKDIDYNAAARRIRELTNITGMHVQLLGLCENEAEKSSYRRELITMASLMQGGQVCAEVKMDIGTNWIDAVKTVYEVGDVIVCFAEQRTGILHRPLSQILESNFKTTVYILSVLTPQKPASSTLPQVAAWLGLIGIIVGFGLLQANVVQLSQGWLQTILLVFSIIPELWLIWIWNGMFS